MLKRLSLIAAGAATLLIPMAAQAAVVTFSYYNVQTSPTLTGTYTNATLGAGNTLNVQPGTFLRFSLRAVVTGNQNSAANIGSGDPQQPTNLGLGAVGFGITDSNATAVALSVQGTGPRASVNGNFTSINTRGAAANSQVTGLAGSNIGNTVDATNASNLPKFTIGSTTGTSSTVDANDLVFSNLTYSVGASGTATIATTFGTQDIAVIIPGADALAPSYANRTLVPGVTDTVNGAGNLVVNVVPEPATLGFLGTAAVGVLVRRRRA